MCLVQIHTFDSSRVGFQLGESFTLSMVSFQSSCGLISNVHCEKNQMIDTSLHFLINGLNVYLSYFYCQLKGFFFKKSYLQFKNLPLEFFDVCALDHVSLTLPLRNPAPLPDQFKQHIHRLIGYLQVLMVLK